MSGVTVTYDGVFGTATRQTPLRKPTTSKPPAAKPTPHGGSATPAAQALALAHAIEKWIDRGHVRDYTEAAQRLGRTKGNMNYIMNLLLLSPHIQDCILTGDATVSLRQLRPVCRVVRYDEQDELITRLLNPTDPVD